MKALEGPKVSKRGTGIKSGRDINTLVEPKITLKNTNIIFKNTDIDINDCSYWLYMRWVFASIHSLSYWGMGESNSNSRSSYVFKVEYIFIYLCSSFLSQSKSCSLLTKLAKHWFT